LPVQKCTLVGSKQTRHDLRSREGLSIPSPRPPLLKCLHELSLDSLLRRKMVRSLCNRPPLGPLEADCRRRQVLEEPPSPAGPAALLAKRSPITAVARTELGESIPTPPPRPRPGRTTVAHVCSSPRQSLVGLRWQYFPARPVGPAPLAVPADPAPPQSGVNGPRWRSPKKSARPDGGLPAAHRIKAYRNSAFARGESSSGERFPRFPSSIELACRLATTKEPELLPHVFPSRMGTRHARSPSSSVPAPGPSRVERAGPFVVMVASREHADPQQSRARPLIACTAPAAIPPTVFGVSPSGGEEQLRLR